MFSQEVPNCIPVHALVTEQNLDYICIMAAGTAFSALAAVDGKCVDGKWHHMCVNLDVRAIRQALLMRALQYRCLRQGERPWHTRGVFALPAGSFSPLLYTCKAPGPIRFVSVGLLLNGSSGTTSISGRRSTMARTCSTPTIL